VKRVVSSAMRSLGRVPVAAAGVALSVAVVLGPCGSALAATDGGAGASALQAQISQLSAQAQSIQQQLGSEQSALSQAEANARYWERKRGAAASQIADEQQAISSLDAQLGQVGQQVQQATSSLEAAEARLGQLQGEVDQALVTLAEGGSVHLVEVLLSAATFSEFLGRFELLKTIFAFDVGLMRQERQQRDLIDQQRQQLFAEQQNLTNLETQAQQQVARLRQEAVDYQQSASAEEARQAQLSSEIRAEEQASAAVTAELANAQLQYNRASGKLTFDWPLPAPHIITSPFGQRYIQAFREYDFHTGVDIAEPTGTPIHAAADGVVVSAGWNGGYGNCVIIYDGKADGVNYYTLYAHQSRVGVQKGQDVQQGQVIGYVGMTGNATGPHLHFEIRKNGQPVDPMPYLPQVGVERDY
jgi:murein DD-endopeptidase MepM/ murein hydrolase activator NlpD